MRVGCTLTRDCDAVVVTDEVQPAWIPLPPLGSPGLTAWVLVSLYSFLQRPHLESGKDPIAGRSVRAVVPHEPRNQLIRSLKAAIRQSATNVVGIRARTKHSSNRYSAFSEFEVKNIEQFDEELGRGAFNRRATPATNRVRERPIRFTLTSAHESTLPLRYCDDQPNTRADFANGINRKCDPETNTR